MRRGGKRPGRAMGAERRRIARNEILAWSHTEAWYDVPARVRCAIETLVPQMREKERTR